MTVGELIAELQQHDPNSLVLVNGYEGGFQAPEIHRRLVSSDRWYSHCGPWSDVDDGDTDVDVAVIVSRGIDER
jgi:hypothetical protein